jgi:hypothetical protein
MMRTTTILFGSISLLLSIAAHRASAEPSNVDLDRARALREEAIAAGDKQDWASCEKKAAEAWEIAKNPVTAGLLGLCERQNAHYRLAAEHLDYALRVDDNPARKANNQKEFDEARKHVGLLKLGLAPAACEIRIDAQPAMPAPERLFVEPGHVRMEVTKEGYVPHVEELDIGPGEEKRIVVTLERAVTPAGRRPIWPWIVGGSIGAAGAVTGAVLLGVAATKDSTATDDAKKASGNCPRAATSDPCADGADAVAASNGMKIGGYVAFGIGAAGLAAGAVLFAALPAEKAIAVVPLAGPDVGGAQFTMHF